jgi:HK97 family phage major capsid protein
MFHLNAALHQRHNLRTELDALLQASIDSGKDLSGEGLKKFHSLSAELKDVDNRIYRHQNNLPQLDAAMPGPTFFPADKSVSQPPSGPKLLGRTNDGKPVFAFSKGESLAAHYGHADDPDISLGEIVRSMLLGGGRKELRAALAEGTDSAGGYTAPVSLQSQVIDKLRARSTVFQAGAKTVPLETKETSIVTIVTDPTATWRAENSDVSSSDAAFGVVQFNPHTLAVVVPVSQELVEDSLNLDEALNRSLSAAFAAELDRVALLGSGSGDEPKGISNVSGIGSVSAGTNGAAPTNWNLFVQALGTLRAANAADPTACIINPHVDQELNLLVDSTGQPLRKPQAIETLPFLVTSKLPQTETQGSSNLASHAMMGDFTDLMVGIRTSLQIRILRERYMDKLQIGVLAYLRCDIAVAHAASFCKIVGLL